MSSRVETEEMFSFSVTISGFLGLELAFSGLERLSAPCLKGDNRLSVIQKTYLEIVNTDPTFIDAC